MSEISLMLKKFLLEGYATSNIDIVTMFICILCTAVIAIYICIAYKVVNKNSFYDRNFCTALFALAIITSAIILTIQSNIVVSLGMVGALSIVRFRTAIKNPMDLVFLFWSISAGIICGAGFAMIAIIASLVLTIGLILFSIRTQDQESMILIVNSEHYEEELILKLVSRNCRTWKVRARNITSGNVNMAIEVKTRHPHSLIEELHNLESVTSVSLVEHNGDITA